MFLLAMIASIAVIAQEAGPETSAPELDPERAYSLAERFARCAALYAHLGDYLADEGLASNAEQMRGAGRGAEIAALFMAGQAGIEENQLAEFVSNLSSLEATRQDAFAERSELDNELMGQCLELQPLQVEIVRLARIAAYSQE